MWKQIAFVFYLFSNLVFAGDPNHLALLKKEFPFGLVTDDYGILNRDDLQINICLAGEAPFTDPPTNYAYSYWQCFPSKDVQMLCEDLGYDRYEKSRINLLFISGQRNGEKHEFMSRRPITNLTCSLFLRDWKHLTKNENHVCISGSHPSKEVENGNILWSWTFGRYKTKKGCDSYFQDECDLREKCDN